MFLHPSAAEVEIRSCLWCNPKVSLWTPFLTSLFAKHLNIIDFLCFMFTYQTSERVHSTVSPLCSPKALNHFLFEKYYYINTEFKTWKNKQKLMIDDSGSTLLLPPFTLLWYLVLFYCIIQFSNMFMCQIIMPKRSSQHLKCIMYHHMTVPYLKPHEMSLPSNDLTITVWWAY